MGNSRIYNLQKTIDNKYIYDVFFENKIIHDILGFDESELTIDLYGQKKCFKKFLLTSKQLNFEIIKSYALRLRPHELNVILNLNGEAIFLYNTSNRHSNSKKKFYLLNQFIYDIKSSAKKDLMKASFYFYYEALKIKIKQIFNKK